MQCSDHVELVVNIEGIKALAHETRRHVESSDGTQPTAMGSSIAVSLCLPMCGTAVAVSNIVVIHSFIRVLGRLSRPS